MEFSISVEELQHIVKLLGVCAKRNTEEPEGRLVIEAQDNKVVFLANNGSVAIQYDYNGAVAVNGAASVVFNKLFSFLNPFYPWDGNSGAKEVKFKLVDNKTVNMYVENVFEGGQVSKNRLKLSYFNAYSVERPDSFSKPTFILNSSILKTAISKAQYVVNPSERREQIQGINVEFLEDNIYFIGTDGVLLSEYRVENKNELNDKKFHVKFDFLNELHKVLSNIEEETQVFIEIDRNKIKAKFNQIYMEGRLNIGHEFPEHRPALESFTNVVLINKTVLMGALNPIMDVLDKDDYNRITIELNGKDLKIYSDVSRFEYDGELDFNSEFIVDVNGKFLRKIIEAIRDDKLLFKFSNPLGALIFDSDLYRNQNTLITPIRRRT
jgi:DNA polymerase III sliding clamp (beta) subunit (PCNA family)